MRIEQIDILGFRCLDWVSLPVEGFHWVSGDNGAGKSTLLDAIRL
ncbi:MAG: AAA family ATPase, partial [Bradymonadaceae bacterium]